ncbi:MAG: glycoside hydrolase family 15 protein [Chthonomonadales bacterium]
MPRPLITGNGNLLVCLDSRLAIRDLYWPYVGLHNHLSGNRARIGVWADGRFSWIHDPSWNTVPRYLPGTLATDAVAENRDLGITLTVNDCVHHWDDILLRRFLLENDTDVPRQVRLFLAHDFLIAETDIADTAFYNPFVDAMIHYKRDTYFLIAARTEEGGIRQYAAGIKGFRGAEGTWRDAEDGELSMNPVAQGSVDSTISVWLTLAPRGCATAHAWICAGHTLDEAVRLHQHVEREGFQTLFDETNRRWEGWSERGMDRVSTLPEPIPDIFRRSLLVIRANTDNRGAIIAANDSDIMETARAHYSYMWPRDGALVVAALNRLGCDDIARRFFLFCRDILPKDRPAFMHKYMADGSWGATWHPWVVDGKPEIPFQEDSTALVVWAFWSVHQQCRSPELAGALYGGLIRPCADFMAGFRDEKTGLPLPSYDLWEERRGVHAYTCGAVYGALRAAADLAGELGDASSASKWRQAADEIRAGIEQHLWDENASTFARRLVETPDGYQRDLTVDSALAALWQFGAFQPTDPKVEATMRRVISCLWVKTNVGGIARYENDYYFRRVDDLARVPGNPWIICTLWAARWYIARAASRQDMGTAMELILWAARRAMPSGVLPEQLHPETGDPLSVAPLTWSHSEFITAVLDYLDAWDALSQVP